MNVCHIITVGTSLLMNSGGELNARRPQMDKVNTLNAACNNARERLIANGINIKQLATTTNVLQCLCRLNPETENNFRSQCDSLFSDRLPQELSYLWLRKGKELIKQPKKPEVLYFLPSQTPESTFCAHIIKQYIEGYNDLKNYFKVNNICPVEGIDAYDGEKFRKEGIRNLFEVVHELIKVNIKKIDRIYLNITGGYKGIVPYTTLQGMVYPSEKVTICYLYESSPDIIEIPSYPIGLDFHLWHRNSTRLKMVREHNVDCFKKNLDDKMRNLLKDNNDLDALGKQLEERYHEQYDKQPLEVYSKEIVEKLLPDSLGGNPGKCRSFLGNIINKAGVNIWTGDKIPEMVEHARRHHHNLLEFAEMFLTPIFAENDTFLNIKERFCLIASLLLHDCGHSIDYMDTGRDRFGLVPLFPGEIRKYHHLLAPRRLEDPDLGKTIGWYLKGIGIDEKLHDAVMTVCRYHRRSMPFNEDEEEFNNPITEETFPPLIKCRNNFEDIGVDIMRVTALMRLIDGCDNQASRAGSKEDVEITLELLKKDYESTRKREEEALEAYKYVCIAIKDNADNELKVGCNYVDCTNIKLTDEYMDFRIKCLETVKNGKNDGDKTLARLWLTAAELVDRADMKHKQDEHYLKHQCVERVRVIPSEKFENNNLQFDIVLYKNGKIADKYLDEKMKDFIEGEVASEYCRIEKYLADEHKFRLRYWWEEEYNKEDNGGETFYEYYG